jgi:hypothetical protein
MVKDMLGTGGPDMGGVAGDAKGVSLRGPSNHLPRLEFHGSTVTFDAGLLAFRELDDGFADEACRISPTRIGQNSRHSRTAWFRHSVFGLLSGYEDANDAGRLGCAKAGDLS